MINLTNQVALVTGAGQGIGRASAEALAAAGAHVIIADIDRAKAEAVADAIGATQRRSLAVQADVGDLTEIDRMVREALERFGQIDILLNNAGVTRRADIMDITEADWDRIHRVNAKGGVLLPAARGTRDDPASQRPHHQRGLDCRQRL
ncbi:MAG: SDR family NAD(P)-dependent oxidoreductase [Acetobacteraceae bacterium]